MKEDKMHLINKIFNNETIRTIWDKEKEKYYISVIDNDIEGFVDTKNKIIGVQYLPIDTLDIDEDVIRQFIKNMK